jgi:N-acylneuraminate cytidylyltransferase
MNMNVLAVILARAGSTGLPNKHLLPLLGRAVISYTFDHAQSATTVSRTVVSSDCRHVRSLATRAGFPSIERPWDLSTAEASVQDVMLHAMESVERSGDFQADALVVLYGNVPVRGEGVIDRAVSHLFETRCDSVRTFCPVGKWHPTWMSRLEGDSVIPHVPGSIHRRQDLQPLFLHDGAVVAVTRSALLRGRMQSDDPHAFFGTDRRGIRTEPGETVEIDEQRDLYLAEAALRQRADAAASGGAPMLRQAV